MGKKAARNRTIKVPDEVWHAWKKAATAAGYKRTSEWIRDRLDKAMSDNTK
jgi:hypothetical protein